MDKDRIQELIDHPSESLSVELKSWFNPDSPEGIAKIVRAAMAMRNHGGGYILIGFNNETGEPEFSNVPEDVKTFFHIDKIQGLISKYSSELFEIKVHYRSKTGLESPIFPIIEISSGVKTPVSAKADLRLEDRKYLIRTNRIYVRSLSANNMPSTTEATWRDYEKLVEVCFENREADIGRFLRRHIGGLSPGLIGQIAESFSQVIQPRETIAEKLRGYLQESSQRFEEAVKERNLNLPDHGSWEVALIIDGEVAPYSANREFLNLLDSANPNYTGWPVWLDSRNFADTKAGPYVYNDAWEAIIVFLNNALDNQIDFLRFDPKGMFYNRRALKDDISINDRRPSPMTALDFVHPIIRTAEAIAVGLAFAKAMGCDLEMTQLFFGFKWSKLRGRVLCSWTQPGRHLRPRTAYQDEVLSVINVPLETPLSAISQYVYEVIKKLYGVFDGFDPGPGLVEDSTKRLLERRL